ncbi:MAG: ABC transporter permease [Lautropia sp.]|nr:ABC transporter permease [Lautropia sp.]
MTSGWLGTWWQIIALLRKEFLAIFKEPANRIILVVPAFLQALLYGYAASYDLTHVRYAVLDQSHSAASTELLARLDDTGVFQRVASLTSSAQIAAPINVEDALMVLSIAPDFAERLNQGEASPVQLILDGRNSSTAASAASHVSTIVRQLNEDMMSGKVRFAQGASTAGSRSTASIIRIETRAWYNPNLESRWTLMPALIAGLSMIQTLMLAALSVAREREQGTFDQLLVTPLTPMQILIGKAVPAITIGLLQSTIILLIIHFWFQIPMNGSAALLYLGLLVFNLAAVGLGLSISALSLTMQQAMLYAFLLIMPLMMLSGMLTPVQNMPEVLQVATLANPLRFGMAIVRGVYLEGSSMAELWRQFVPLLLMSAITLPLAAWLFRHRLG